MHSAAKDPPGTSSRVQATDAPVIAKTKALMAGVQGVQSLAQGIVHWAPPAAALQAVAEATADPALSQYGPDAGLPELRQALRDKLAAENGLTEVDVMVTAGANQAFTNVVLALLDAHDSAVLFRPYYFNHLMALQMTGGAQAVRFGPCDPASWHPDLDWLEAEIQGNNPPKMVVLVNPCNPTGVLLSKAELERAAALCASAGVWLIVDNTYEHFTYDGTSHHCVSGPNVVNLFSFSKAYGMMGWRVGYIVHPLPTTGAAADLSASLDKVQDTIPICPSQAGQLLALRALQEGRSWVTGQVQQLQENREAVLDALTPLGTIGSGIADAKGAIYLWAALPPGCEDDEAVVAWLVREHKVCVIPGTSCGAPGHVRAAFANLTPAATKAAAAALKGGLEQLVREGPAVLRPMQGTAVPAAA